MNDRPVIEIENLTKTFGGLKALDGVSLEIRAGSIVGLLGANGSGKSTLIRHMIGLYLPTEGTCTTLSRDAAALTPRELARIGYVHQEGELIDWMRVSQLIRFVASYYPTWNEELEKTYCARFEIDGFARVGSLSPGQRQKVAILLAIGFEPDLLLLDEPAAALDPLSRLEFLDLLLEIIQDPKRTILVSSHILSDVEKVIDHVIILDKGRILCDRGLDELRESYAKVRLVSLDGPLPDPLPFAGALAVERGSHEAMLTVETVRLDELDRLCAEIRALMETIPLTLEELYRVVVAHAGEKGDER